MQAQNHPEKKDEYEVAAGLSVAQTIFGSLGLDNSELFLWYPHASSRDFKAVLVVDDLETWLNQKQDKKDGLLGKIGQFQAQLRAKFLGDRLLSFGRLKIGDNAVYVDLQVVEGEKLGRTLETWSNLKTASTFTRPFIHYKQDGSTVQRVGGWITSDLGATSSDGQENREEPSQNQEQTEFDSSLQTNLRNFLILSLIKIGSDQYPPYENFVTIQKNDFLRSLVRFVQSFASLRSESDLKKYEAVYQEAIREMVKRGFIVIKGEQVSVMSWHLHDTEFMELAGLLPQTLLSGIDQKEWSDMNLATKAWILTERAGERLFADGARQILLDLVTSIPQAFLSEKMVS